LRIIIKISGEFLNNEDIISRTAFIINDLFNKGHKIGVVIGGGNLVRGRDHSDKRSEFDIIGMYSTVINGLVLKMMINNSKIINSFSLAMLDDAKKEEIENSILIFTGGLGVPYFSTDTAAVVRALDIGADLILKSTKVDGVYDRDPSIEGAKKYDKLTYGEVLSNRLNAIDLTAASLALTHNKKMVIFDGTNPDNIYKAIEEEIGTVIEA
tara:strand:- start:35095 stop:35727 length:633 start_codon:yes stop_codon:yes gene_type:complete